MRNRITIGLHVVLRLGRLDRTAFVRVRATEKSSKVFVGKNVYKESIDITLAEQGGEERRLG